MDDVGRALDLLRREGPQPVYKIAKALGLSYGAAQWLVFRMEREGLVRTVKVGGRRYVCLPAGGGPPARLRDLLAELRRAVKGLEDETPERAVEELERRGMREAAEALRLLARAFFRNLYF
ncbi:MAG: helix-turn-helix domain-containing protein [Thermoproteus sp.]